MMHETNEKRQLRPKHWKTALVGLLTMLFQVLETTGVIKLPEEVRNAIITLAIFLIGLLAADAS